MGVGQREGENAKQAAHPARTMQRWIADPGMMTSVKIRSLILNCLRHPGAQKVWDILITVFVFYFIMFYVKLR